ncbi:response regulator [Gramella sp. GC03-9]|uniref:Response regulator n=1 Tax=Christiangramia oceanisediminis TaxID=2920386 RepID=A0A9X2RDJ7_9FLAO|nr:response regulator [Gramella oceanisediminis]MCP9201340.1 response regulator [Gramella oceanisediminis]
MFNNVLIAEDQDFVNLGIREVLQNLEIEKITHSQYCDEAYLKLKRAALDNKPFDLLICDLNFKADHRNEKIESGEALASLLKKEIPDLKIIINTVEEHPSIVKRVWSSGIADAYVIKDRNGFKSLETAIKKLTINDKYLAPSIEGILSQSNVIELSDYELELLKYVSKGYSQEEIHQVFKNYKISPNSKSSIEKKLKELRELFEAKTNPHLITVLKDLQII